MSFQDYCIDDGCDRVRTPSTVSMKFSRRDFFEANVFIVSAPLGLEKSDRKLITGGCVTLRAVQYKT